MTASAVVFVAGHHRRAVRHADRVQHPLSARDGADIELFVRAETVGRAADRLVRPSPDRPETEARRALRALRTETKSWLWGFGSLVLRGPIAGDVDARRCDDARESVRDLLKRLTAAVEELTGLTVGHAFSESDRADAGRVLAMVARSYYGVRIAVPWPTPWTSLDWVTLEPGSKYLADLGDTFVWLDRVVYGDDDLYAFEARAARWYYERRTCTPETADERVAMFERLKEWFFLDRKVLGSGIAPITRAAQETRAHRDHPDWEMEMMSAAAYRAAGSRCGIFLVRTASWRTLVLEDVVTGESHDVDEPATQRGMSDGDYMFGRPLRRVRPGAGSSLRDPSSDRKDLSLGSVGVTIDDRRRERTLLSWVKAHVGTFPDALLMEGALRVARGESPAPRAGRAVETPGNARAVLACLGGYSVSRRVDTESDVAMAEWQRALRAEAT